MNSMLLLEAVGHLDDDLLERSERAHGGNRRWLQWVAIAACACVVLAGAWGVLSPKKASDSAMNMEIAPEEDHLILDSADSDVGISSEDNSVTAGNTAGTCYILAGGEDTLSYPLSFVIKDQKTLTEYYVSNQAYLEGSAFKKVSSQYDAAFFETKELIVLVLEEKNPVVTHHVEDTHWDAETQQWEVSLRRMIPMVKAQASGPSYWYILIEVDAGKTAQNATVHLSQSTYRETAPNEWTFVAVDE